MTTTSYPVTDHACLRYLSRILLVRLGPLIDGLPREASNGDKLRAACRALGLDREKLRRQVLPEPLLSALAMAARIQIGGHTCVINNGCVVTVLQREGRGWRTLRIRSAAEARKGRHRNKTRRKWT